MIPIGPGGVTHWPCGAAVMASPRHAAPPLPSCTWHLMGLDVEGVHVHGLQLAAAAVTEAIDVPSAEA